MVISKPAFTSMTFLNIETVALAFLVTVIAIPWLINLSNKWKLFDVPEGDALKIHNEHISYLGGAALFLGIMGSAVLLIATLSLYRLELAGFVSAALLLFGLGLWDDIKWKHISQARPYFKFGLLIIVPLLAATFVSLSGLEITAGVLLLTILVIAFYIFVFINALNYQDGMDGLAGSLSILSFGAFAFIGLMTQNMLVTGISFALLGTVLAFLLFNFPPARIFMGDSGAYVLGLSLAILALLVSDFHVIQGVLGPLFLFGVPLFEGLFTNARRVFQGQSIFRGDRSHTYDYLLQHGYSAKKVLALFSFVQLLSVAIGAWLVL